MSGTTRRSALGKLVIVNVIPTRQQQLIRYLNKRSHINTDLSTSRTHSYSITLVCGISCLYHRTTDYRVLLQRATFMSFASRVLDTLQRRFESLKSIMANIDSTPWERPSVSDVLEVKEILLKVSRLPIEIVEEIVDFAEYWPYTTTTCGVKLARGGANEDVLIVSLISKDCVEL